ERLSEEFVKQDEDGIDIEWLKKEIVPKFVLKQEALLKKKNIQLALDHNDNELLEKTLSSYNKVIIDESKNIGGIMPAKKMLYDFKSKNDKFIIGTPFVDGYPITIVGDSKVGKTTTILGFYKRFINEIKNSHIQRRIPKIVWLLTEGAIRDLLMKLQTFNLLENVLIAAKPNKDTIFNLDSPKDRNLIKSYIENYKHKIAFCVIDSLRGAKGKSDTNLDQIGEVMNRTNQIICDHFQLTNIWTAHENKKGEYSGNTSIKGNCRYMFIQKKHENSNTRTLTCQSYNGLLQPPDYELQLSEDNEIIITESVGYGAKQKYMEGIIKSIFKRYNAGALVIPQKFINKSAIDKDYIYKNVLTTFESKNVNFSNATFKRASKKICNKKRSWWSLK
ncbi:MAG: hypothetical protein ACFFDF_19015, partial [Candidatus Odinarchaeota archaeon]